jgi:hypothetical protein
MVKGQKKKKIWSYYRGPHGFGNFLLELID